MLSPKIMQSRSHCLVAQIMVEYADNETFCNGVLSPSVGTQPTTITGQVRQMMLDDGYFHKSDKVRMSVCACMCRCCYFVAVV